ncbi:ATPase AAA domain-containing protein 5 [Massospora cicadina]|nr:ATPase AAA domain-containing protein 5 [Massospora cicadina]
MAAPKKKFAVKKNAGSPSIQSFFLPAKTKAPKAANGLGKRKQPEPASEVSKNITAALENDEPQAEEGMESDPNQQRQGLHVAKRQKWMREFMAGKEAHPFFFETLKSKPSAGSQLGVATLRPCNPIEAPLPGPPTESRSPPTKLDLASPGNDEFLFPSSPKAWIEIFKRFGNTQLDERCYRDFLWDSGPKSANSNGDWLKVYSATSTKHFLGNQSTLADIRVWLEKWKVIACNQDAPSDDDTVLGLPISEDDSDYGSSSSRRSKAKRPGRAVNKMAGRRKRSKPRPPPITILSGPSGVGKTAAVHACAHDCGYQVLEINATSARTGSELTSLVGQLSKSHLVNSVNSSASFFHVKSKKAPKPNLLILIDEADLLFHGERSFLTALTQLATETRRPFILTTNGPIPDFNVPKALLNASIGLERPPPGSLATFLQLMGDFRKLVLELELMSRVQSPSNNIKPAADALPHLLPTIQVDSQDPLSDLPLEQKLVTLLSTPHYMLGHESAAPICPDDLDLYMGHHFSAPSSPDYGWPSHATQHQAIINHQSALLDTFWPGEFSKGPKEAALLESYSDMMNILAYADTFEPRPVEMDSLQAPETCLLTPPLLDADDDLPNGFRFHTCPNKANTFSSPDFLPPACWVDAHRNLACKHAYSSEFIKGAFNLLKMPSLNLLKLALGGHVDYLRRPLYAALSSVLPPSTAISSFDDNVCLLLPHFSQIIEMEGSHVSRLRSKRTLTSQRLLRAKSAHLDTLVKCGRFVHPSQATTPCQTDSSARSEDDSS